MLEISKVWFLGCWRQPLHSTLANLEGLEQQEFSEDFESDYLQTGQAIYGIGIKWPITPTQSIDEHNVSSGHKEIYV